MYGMIHRSIREMIVNRLGQATWDDLEAEVGIGPGELISLQLYSDEQTLAILAAAARRLDMTLEQTLGQFGREWIAFASHGMFASIMDFTGRDLTGFIENMDRMHQAVAEAMPGARMPSFSLARNVGNCLVVQYRSERSGLEPFVIGLFEGLLERFGKSGQVRQLGNRGDAIEFEIVIEGD